MKTGCLKKEKKTIKFTLECIFRKIVPSTAAAGQDVDLRLLEALVRTLEEEEEEETTAASTTTTAGYKPEETTGYYNGSEDDVECYGSHANDSATGGKYNIDLSLAFREYIFEIRTLTMQMVYSSTP